MPEYSKVQFIAWEIYTGAVYGPSGADHYAGLAPAAGDRRFHVLSQCLDIMARVEFTRRAIETAYKNAQADSETLKIFMAPEFLYRGAAGDVGTPGGRSCQGIERKEQTNLYTAYGYR